MILMCTEICDGAGVGICDSAPSTCSSFIYFSFAKVYPPNIKYQLRSFLITDGTADQK